MQSEVRVSRSAKRLADDWQIKQSVLTTKSDPKKSYLLAQDQMKQTLIPGPDEAGSDPPSSEKHESQRNAAGIGSSSSTSTELRPSMEDVAVEAEDTVMPESAHPAVPRREETSL